MLCRLISAEIPDREADPELYDLVSKCMVHGELFSSEPACTAEQER